ncbi:lysosomal alpha-mannosidase-like [Tigriopus californicus]|uniref:lysosomal alpha-mannosidase-like n=1 Tax=Tigriopus californicus TaxID=6832 RepID=UPI0027DA778B|nr:lysosomal alpha-mannosidase-like [Tigriopus californicus]
MGPIRTALPLLVIQLFSLEVWGTSPWFVPGPKEATCGYDGCPKIDPAMINVHLVPHSHDDVGWKKTVDQYYYGDKQWVQRAGVQYIFDGIVQELSLDPSKKFIQVEIAYFWRWWSQASEETKSMVHQMVNEGRIEFIGGGWSMNDEAATHYTGLIDNMALGFKQIKDIFGDCGIPRVAWQIDPFGHSKEQANLFAQMGFDGLFFARIDYRDKAQRMESQEMQMVWEGSDSLGEDSSIFTGVFTDLYAAPSGFQFDMRYDDDPIVDDIRLREYNLKEKIDLFVETVLSNMTKYQSQTNLMFTMGGDFNFQIANLNYQNLDKLIKYVNERSGETNIRAFYSTPSCFLKALNDEGLTWPTKTDDFFPYADGPNSYWSGYFTSRPSFKFHERQTNGMFQAAKQVAALFQAPNMDELFDLQRALGVAQHHDAITGTNHADVDADYHLRLHEGQLVAQGSMTSHIFPVLNQVIEKDTDYTCSRLNISSCSWTEENGQLTVTIYNPLPRALNYNVRLPVQDKMTVRAFDATSELSVEYVPIPNEILALEERRQSLAVLDAIFRVTNIPAMGYKVIYIDQTPIDESLLKPLENMSPEDFQKEMPDNFNVQLGHYLSHQDYDTQASGAYIFWPLEEKAEMSTIVSSEKYEGGLLNEWRLKLSIDWASLIVRKYEDSPEYEVEWLVGPIPIDGDELQGKEIILRYTDSGVANEGRFFTDANGRQMIQRQRDARPSFDLEDGAQEEPIASNYYPITSGIFIGDETSQLSLLNDRSQGGSSLKDGEIELMVHRRTLVDDRRGLLEVLNETAFEDQSGLIVRGKHFFFQGNEALSTVWRRTKMQEQFLQPSLLFFDTLETVEDWQASSVEKTWSGINSDELGDNVHVVSLEPWDDGQILLRLEHFFEAQEKHARQSQSTTIDLNKLFQGLTVLDVLETTLGGNAPLESMERLHWNTHSWNSEHDAYHSMVRRQQDTQISLEPMQIRTFILTIES